MVKNGHGLLVLETLKFAYLKNEFMNWTDFVDVDSDVTSFGHPTLLSALFNCSCTFCCKICL